MWNVGLDEAQAGIKIVGRNINNLRYADNTTFMAESEELKSLLIKVEEDSEKVGLKFNIQKTEVMVSGPIISWEIDGETVETVADFIFSGLQNRKGVCQGCILSPCLFNLHAEYIMRNAGRKWRGTKKPLDESERGEWKKLA